jgi:hypothetical protein
MAATVVAALLDGDPMLAPKIEGDFLDHCISCQDKLAFMLATRDLRRHEIALGDRWARVAAWLEGHSMHGSRQKTDAAPASATAGWNP